MRYAASWHAHLHARRTEKYVLQTCVSVLSTGLEEKDPAVSRDAHFLLVQFLPSCIT